MWKINAGRRSAYAEQFLQHNVVAIGWREGGDYSSCTSRSAVTGRVRAAYPDKSDQQVNVAAAQIWRFMTEIRVSDTVITYDPISRTYPIGQIAGDAQYRPDLIEQLPLVRSVSWVVSKRRDELSAGTKGNLGAILTLFRVSPRAAAELLGENVADTDNRQEPADIPSTASPDPDLEADPFDVIAELALERTKDRLLRLGWDDMQEIVAALLRALGYRTVISPAGPDRGRDIVASRDGFGFERPRIVVEVKHRRDAMGAPEIRSFVGGRHADDRGLYVSTGGFTREAQYEADRASMVTHLMTLDGLARALIENYDNLDQRGRALLPLTRIYWPS